MAFHCHVNIHVVHLGSINHCLLPLVALDNPLADCSMVQSSSTRDLMLHTSIIQDGASTVATQHICDHLAMDYWLLGGICARSRAWLLVLSQSFS